MNSQKSLNHLLQLVYDFCLSIRVKHKGGTDEEGGSSSQGKTASFHSSCLVLLMILRSQMATWKRNLNLKPIY